MGNVDGEKYCLKWNDFEKNIGAAFRDLRKENELFDVTLAGESFQIKAHKVVLTACSNLFRDIIRSNPHQHPLLYLKGMKKRDLQSLLDFVYEGEVNVSQENLSSFLQCAEELQIKGLSENKTTQSEETDTIVKAEESNTLKRHLSGTNLGQLNKKKKMLPYPNHKQILNCAESTQSSSQNESNFVEVKQDPDSPEQNQQFEPSESFDHDVMIDNGENEEDMNCHTVEPFAGESCDDFVDYDGTDYTHHNVFDEDGGDSSSSSGMFISPSRGGNSANRSWVWNYMGFLVPGTGSHDHTLPTRGAPPGTKRVTCKLCYKTFAYHNSTSSLANHLKTYHLSEVVVPQDKFQQLNYNLGQLPPPQDLPTV